MLTHHSFITFYLKRFVRTQEYVENQIGRTYFGDIGNFWDRNSDTQNGVGSDSWQYHQYDPAVMEAQ